MPIIESRIAGLNNNATLCMSPLVRLETLVKPMRDNNAALIQCYEQFLDSLHTLSMPDQIYQEALLLRVKHNLKTPDALHVATAQFHGCQQFWTNDRRLANVFGNIAVNILD